MGKAHEDGFQGRSDGMGTDGATRGKCFCRWGWPYFSVNEGLHHREFPVCVSRTAEVFYVCYRQERKQKGGGAKFRTVRVFKRRDSWFPRVRVGKWSATTF